MKKTQLNKIIKKNYYLNKQFRIVNSRIIDGKIIFNKHYKKVNQSI